MNITLNDNIENNKRSALCYSTMPSGFPLRKTADFQNQIIINISGNKKTRSQRVVAKLNRLCVFADLRKFKYSNHSHENITFSGQQESFKCVVSYSLSIALRTMQKINSPTRSERNRKNAVHLQCG